MAINLKGLSAKELGTLISTAKKRQSALSKRKPVAGVRRKLTALAKTEGYTIAELFGGATSSKATGTKAIAKKVRKLGKVPPKYRNPANPKEIWSGRGKQPLWLAALIKKGKKVEEFLIRK